MQFYRKISIHGSHGKFWNQSARPQRYQRPIVQNTSQDSVANLAFWKQPIASWGIAHEVHDFWVGKLRSMLSYNWKRNDEKPNVSVTHWTHANMDTAALHW